MIEIQELDIMCVCVMYVWIILSVLDSSLTTINKVNYIIVHLKVLTKIQNTV